MAWTSVGLHRLEVERRDLKADLEELSNVSYGLFNVNVWRDTLTAIVERKVRTLEITDENRAEIKRQTEQLLYQLLDDAQQVLRARNKKAGIGGAVRQFAMDMLVDMESLRAGVPRYAETMLSYAEKPEHRDELAGVVVRQMDQLADSTAGRIDNARIESILRRHGSSDAASCRQQLHDQVESLRLRAIGSMWPLLAAVLLITALVLFNTAAAGRFGLLVMVCTAIALLVNGLHLPMIEIEAAIREFAFELMGEHVAFYDQVLFYQSKSILEVVHVLLTDGDAGLLVVGVLVLAFSVLIPFSKLIASLITIQSRRAPRNRFHRFLVFKSGKWSMADVLVVAIFMAFVGFNGIVSSQMELVEDYTDKAEIITTNRSGLQVGFYLFLSYCLLGLVLGARIKHMVGPDPRPAAER
ncbi:MAG: paraquat-inducible protein A [Flavobacteriales bacterium]|nr:paraquat-inducible protein A [Flavobacteriales bacterium]